MLEALDSSSMELLASNTSPESAPSLLHRPLKHFARFFNMRWVLSCLFLAVLGVVQALSSSGNRLLVVLEDAADKTLFSKFWTDLGGSLRPSVLLGSKSC